MKKLLLPAFLVFSFNALALVDYSTPVQADPQAQAGLPKSKAPSAPRATEASSSGERYFSVTSGIETLELPYQNENNKVSMYALSGHFQTPYNIYMDASYWAASAKPETVTDKGSIQLGNPTIKLGLNWLTLGGAQDLATFDFTAGLMLAGPKNSDFASSRMDKMFGVELTKRFYDFALQLGYEYRLAGDPKLSRETPTGNIQKITTSLGWKVSYDISFALEGVMYKVGRNDLNRSGAGLSNDLNFAYVSPKLSLGLASFIDLEMGALYRTRRVSPKDDIVEARLWDLKGLYGNSLFANLVLSL